ncbi:SIS domain-containing protein [Solirubrobacter phytolaccae]|uniref:SIS domain-containing protein n=1 Tax=Solirubrobacter phytolaccae TaxID=1404360 RepID=A0A9X3N8C7_9ACTN|nr:SIS domain-containing protein [Solirubrobacter phytolaccae]MDA0181870.1 SIS domain-containing protein [Solirubrobacter phytolaccae]
MAEQPEVLARLLSRRISVEVERPAGVIIVARGSSDHAAVYGRYLLELATGRPVALAAPSLFTRYGAQTDASGWLVVGVSQSGRTPEIVDVVERLRATGGRAIAITNNEDSPLAEAAEAVIGLGAGEEKAVPATKTYTAQMAAFAVLAASLGTVPWTDGDLALVPDAVAGVLADPDGMGALADRWAGIDQLVVTARGWMFSAALETALKVRETALVSAQGFSVADFLHGPIAAVDPGAAVLALRAEGPAAADVDEAVSALTERGADLQLMPAVGGLPEALAPIAASVRGQQLALELALRKDLDPDAPRGLNKVTITR